MVHFLISFDVVTQDGEEANDERHRHGRGSPSNRSDAAYQAGLGRLFLEVGTREDVNISATRMLTRKAKQVVSTVTTTSARCYVLNRWDLLRRVDKSFIEHVQSEQAQRTAMSSNDRALIGVPTAAGVDRVQRGPWMES